MQKTKVDSKNANTDCNAVQHVAGVAGVAEPSPPKWPPAWLAALNPPSDAPREVNLAALRLRGWRLPTGIVVCRCCCPKPAEAVPVVLAEGDGGPEWAEELSAGPTPCLSTASPKAASLPEHPRNDPQWL
jgi:hypothetical protein